MPRFFTLYRQKWLRAVALFAIAIKALNDTMLSTLLSDPRVFRKPDLDRACGRLWHDLRIGEIYGMARLSVTATDKLSRQRGEE